MKKKTFFWAVAIACMSPISWAHADQVMASIKPLHSLVQAIMGDTGTAQLLIQSNQSPHRAHLKPSQVKALHSADLIFYIDKKFEFFLVPALASLPEEVRHVALAQAAEIELLKLRNEQIWVERASMKTDHSQEQREHHDDHDDAHHDGDAHGHDGHDDAHHDDDAHGHDDNGHGHDAHHDDDDAHGHDAHHNDDAHGHDAHSHDTHGHGEHDLHIWLDPVMAKVMANAIASALIEAFPDKRAIYQANAERLNKELQQLDQRLSAMLEEIKDQPYIVFHDAYQYFERRYQLTAVASITDAHDGALSPRHLKELSSLVADKQVRCLFSEPQWVERGELLQTIIADSEVEVGVLDPLGVGLPEGRMAYFQLMDKLAASLRDCLVK